MYSWARKQEDGVLYNSTGAPVANQDIFKNIISALVRNDLHVTFRHQLGHINSKNPKHVERAKAYYEKMNRVKIDYYKMCDLCSYNDLIDNLTRSKLDGLDMDDYPIGSVTYMGERMLPKRFSKYIN